MQFRITETIPSPGEVREMHASLKHRNGHAYMKETRQAHLDRGNAHVLA